MADRINRRTIKRPSVAEIAEHQLLPLLEQMQAARHNTPHWDEIVAKIQEFGEALDSIQKMGQLHGWISRQSEGLAKSLDYAWARIPGWSGQ